MLKETGAGVGAETMQKNLSKDREYERIYQQLHNEFAGLTSTMMEPLPKKRSLDFLTNKQMGQWTQTSLNKFSKSWMMMDQE